MKLDSQEVLYAPIGSRGHIDYSCMRCQRKLCKEAFLKDTGMSWDELKKYGWRIIKVYVIIRQAQSI